MCVCVVFSVSRKKKGSKTSYCWCPENVKQ